MSAYSWLMFDVDGTLFDYERAEARALAATLRDVDLPFDEETLTAYRVINDRHWRQFELGLVDQATLKIARFAELLETLNASGVAPAAFATRYLTNLAKGTDLVPGALRTVQALRPHFRLAIITNGLQDVQRPRLAASPLNGLFDVVIVSEEVGYSKPQPEIFEVAFAHMQRPEPDEVLIIGDSLTSDMQGGLNAGIHTCWFNPVGRRREPPLPVTYEIRRLAELPALVGRAATP